MDAGTATEDRTQIQGQLTAVMSMYLSLEGNATAGPAAWQLASLRAIICHMLCFQDTQQHACASVLLQLRQL